MVGKSSKKAIKLAKGITSRTGYAVGGSPFYGQDAYNQLMGDITNQRKAAIPPVGQFDLYKGAKGTAPAAPKGTAPGGEDTKIIPPTDGSSGNYDGGGSGGSEQTETPPDGPPGSFNNPFSGMLDNAINNPGTTAINAGVGLFGGPFGIANSISAAFGGPNVGGLVTAWRSF